MIDKQVIQGEIVAEIAAKNRKSAHLYIEKLDILNVEKGNKVSLALQSLPGLVIRGTLVDISQTKIEDKEGDEGGIGSNCYIGYFESTQMNGIPSVRYGMTGGAKIHTGFKTIFQSILKRIFARFITKAKLIFTH